jgi:tetratricopeptide (TPR) repeat protein
LESLESQIRKLRSLFWSDRDQEGQAFVALAESYRRTGDLDQALELLEEGLERHPHHTSGLLVLGRVHRARGDVDGARAAFEQVVALDGDHLEAVRGLGEVAATAGDADGARAYFERVLELDPQDAEALGSLGALATMAGEAGIIDDAEDAPIEDAVDAAEPVAEAELRDVDEVPDEEEPRDVDEVPDEEEPVDVPEPVAEVEPVAMDEVPYEEEPLYAAEPVVEAEPFAMEEVLEEEEPEVFTRTMAEVYASQGHHSRAIEILEHILANDPEDDAVRSRIEFFREMLGTGEPSSVAERPGEADFDEAHLEDIAEGMAAAAPDDGPIDSPFAWGELEGQDGIPADGTSPVRDYFDGLLSWRPTTPMDAAVVPVEDLEPDEDQRPGVPTPFDHLPLVRIQDLAPDPLSGDGSL